MVSHFKYDTLSEKFVRYHSKMIMGGVILIIFIIKKDIASNIDFYFSLSKNEIEEKNY